MFFFLGKKIYFNGFRVYFIFRKWKKKNFVDVFLFYKSFFEKFFKGINYILGMEEGVEIVYI